MYKKINNDFKHDFDIDKEGIYSIIIEATGEKKQHLKVALES